MLIFPMYRDDLNPSYISHEKHFIFIIFIFLLLNWFLEAWFS